MSLEKVSAFMQALGVAYFIWMGYQAPTSQQETKNFLVAVFLGIPLLLLLVKLFRHSPPVNEESPRTSQKKERSRDALDAFRNPQWETITRRQFTNEQIDIDGKRFWDCTFKAVTLAFHGNAPAEFMGACEFTGPFRLSTDSPAAMHYSKLCQIFSSLPGMCSEYVSTDERGNPLTPIFEIKELTPGTDRRKDGGLAVKDSDPQLEIRIADLRGRIVSEKPIEQACFDLINRGKQSPAKFVCIEDFNIGGYRVAFRSFPPPIAPFGNHDSITPLYINKPDGKLCDKDIFTVFFYAWDDLKNPKLYEYAIPIKATYQDDGQNLFEVRCDLVFYPQEHANHQHPQLVGHSAGTILETKNHKIRKVAPVTSPINWSD